jgi:trk system potassium uptake protein TrkH
VTGLVVRDTGGDFSLLGQLVILTLLQIGGFGIVTFVAMGSILSARIFSVPQMVALSEMFSTRRLSDVRRHVLGIVGAMLLVETVGTLVLFLVLPGEHGSPASGSSRTACSACAARPGSI